RPTRGVSPPPVYDARFPPVSASCSCLLIRRPPPPTLFPYTTLFRSILSIPTTMTLVFHWTALEDGGTFPRIVATVVVMMIFFSSDRKSTRLNSCHVKISYAVFCLKKKKQKRNH